MRRPPVAVLTAFACIAALAALAQVIVELGFTTLAGSALAAEYGRRFRLDVAPRFASWVGFAKQHKSTPFAQALESEAAEKAAETLQIVNDAINQRVKWVDDQKHWQAIDYWATPAESVATAGGDCEDLSIAKYYLLKELGVPVQRLRITYVRALSYNGQAHMVLAYHARPGGEPLILDNIDARVKPASQRKDLEPVYSFNDDEVLVVKGGARGRPSQIRTWLSVQERLVHESSLQKTP